MLKKNVAILIIMVIVGTVSAYCKPPYDFKKHQYYRNKAAMADYEKQYLTAIHYYKKAIKYSANKGNEDLQSFIYCLLNAKDTAQAAKYMKLAISFGYPFFFENMFGKKYRKEILKVYPKLEKQANHKMVESGALKLKELAIADQTIRNVLTRKGNNYFSEEIRNTMLTMVDTNNFNTLVYLIKEEHIFPASLLLYHIYGENKKHFNLIDSVFKAGVFSGKASPESYVQWYDRQRMYVNEIKTQLYGEWNQPGSKEFNPIEDIANIDKRRAEFGLPPLKDYARIRELNLPKDYLPLKADN